MHNSRSMQFLVIASLIGSALASWGEAPKESKQFGAKRLDFLVGDRNGFVIQPAREAGGESKPWVWYAPTFIGQHPDPSHEWMAIQLLDAGFAIAGIDVGESYGSPTGVATYNAFYEFVVREFGFDTKACLLPQSRGGLMLLNWAVENTERVQCIAGIYTVCNIESYPGLDRACGAYDMTEEELRADLASVNPIERLRPLADARIPHFFIHGDSDTVVPIEDNAEKLVTRIAGLGGRAKLMVVPGKGHEVCPEFFESDELMKFLLSEGEMPVD